MPNVHVLSSIHLVDANGDPGIVALHDYMPDTTTLASIVTKVSAMAGEVEVMVDGQILKGTTSIEFPLTAGKGSPVANCEVEKGALFTFNVAGTTYAASFFVPTFKPTLFVGNEVNVADAGVAAFLTNMLANWFDKYDHDITSLKRAVKRFRK